MNNQLGPSTVANQSPDAKVHTIPASVFHSDSNRVKEHYYLFKVGKATSPGKLESRDYCKREGMEIYNFLVQNTPAGIYEELVRQIIAGDITCNCHTAGLLGMSKQEVSKKAQDIKNGKLVPEKVCTKCNTTKPLTKFYKTKIRVKAGYVTCGVQANCIECVLKRLAKKREKS